MWFYRELYAGTLTVTAITGCPVGVLFLANMIHQWKQEGDPAWNYVKYFLCLLSSFYDRCINLPTSSRYAMIGSLTWVYEKQVSFFLDVRWWDSDSVRFRKITAMIQHVTELKFVFKHTKDFVLINFTFILLRSPTKIKSFFKRKILPREQSAYIKKTHWKLKTHSSLKQAFKCTACCNDWLWQGLIEITASWL